MRKLTALLPMLAFSLGLLSQEIVSDSLSIVSQGDTLWQIYSSIEYDNGALQVEYSELMDSATATGFIRNLILDGGPVTGSSTGRKIEGSRRLSRAYQRVLLENQSERERRDLEDLFEVVAGGPFDTSFVNFDSFYLGDWNLIGPDSTVTLTFSRNNSGVLRAKSADNSLNGKVNIKDQLRFEINGLGGTYPSPFIFIRRKSNRDRFQTLDRVHAIRPD